MRPLISLALLLGAVPIMGAPQVGDLALPVQLHNQDDQFCCAADNYGKSWVVLAFYPKDFTGGCTLEAQNISANAVQIKGAGIVVFGISTDDVASKRGFCDKYSLQYTLLADPDKTVCTAWGTLSDRGYSNRVTFYIDPARIVRKVDREVHVQTHGEDILKTIEALRAEDAKTALGTLGQEAVPLDGDLTFPVPAGWARSAGEGWVRWTQGEAPGATLTLKRGPADPAALDPEAVKKALPAGTELRGEDEVYVNGQKALRVDTVADGKFASAITWTAGDHNLTLIMSAPAERAGDAARLLAAVVAGVK